MSDNCTVLYEKNNGIATVRLNRPNVLNSLNVELIDSLINILKEIENDTEVRVIVLTGNGKAFCTGGDLSNINDINNAKVGRDLTINGGKITLALMKIEKPVIAMVNGVAAGAGFNIALACDIVFCSKSTQFIQSFSNVGLIPDCGGTYLLPRIVGLHKAKELMFTANVITADEAKELKIVNEVFENDELETATYRYAQKLTTCAPISLALIKSSLNRNINQNLEDSLELEANLQSICFQSLDNKEGIKAFKEKRKPVFKGI